MWKIVDGFYVANASEVEKRGYSCPKCGSIKWAKSGVKKAVKDENNNILYWLFFCKCGIKIKIINDLK